MISSTVVLQGPVLLISRSTRSMFPTTPNISVEVKMLRLTPERDIP